MSSSANGSSAAAPWRKLFLEHVSKLRSPAFALSTLHPVSSKTGLDASYEPRVRYVIFRGMWGSLPSNDKNPAPRNEPVYESDLLSITTDVRMLKVPELLATAPDQEAAPGGTQDTTLSGGGGPVEAVFWVEDVMTQWRIKGHSFVIGPDIEGAEEVGVGASQTGGSGAQQVREALTPWMRLVQSGNEKAWSWGKELTAHFGNLSPGMRGSFKNPPPGTPLSQKPSDTRLKRGQKVEDLEDEVARTNFRVMIIRPDEVEQIDLTNPEEAQRWKYTFVGDSDKGEAGWIKEELWP